MRIEFGYKNRTIVTAENFDECKDALNAADQNIELAIGCEIWKIQYNGGWSGFATLWPTEGRAAIEFGGDSVWGDWTPETRRIWHAADSIKLETVPGQNWYQLPYHPVDARRILRTAVRDYGYASVAALVDPKLLADAEAAR